MAYGLSNGHVTFLARDNIAYVLSVLYAIARPSVGQTGVS